MGFLDRFFKMLEGRRGQGTPVGRIVDELTEELNNDTPLQEILRAILAREFRVPPESVDYLFREPPPRELSRDKASSPERCWVPAGQSVDISGHRIDGGLIYVGKNLQPVSGRGTEPALIDPGLPVIHQLGFVESASGYYQPTYRKLSPQSRAKYLEWLAGGKSDPSAPAIYFMLYFYGLERRLLADKAWQEKEVIASEVKRMRRICKEYYFRRYSGKFLEAIKTVESNSKPAYENEPPKNPDKWELPLEIKLAIGQLANERKPVPSNWALSWLRAHPETRLLTPATRCKGEFERLWEIRYNERFGDGVIVKPNKRRLQASYYPASPTFVRHIYLPIGDLPDISTVRAPIRKLSLLADACCMELDAYSRWLGRNPDAADSVAAKARLPGIITDSRIEEFCRWIDSVLGGREFAVVETSELAKRWMPGQRDRLTKAESNALTDLLARYGYGIEPDTRRNEASSLTGQVVLLRTTDQRAPSSKRTYKETAKTLVKLAAFVASSNGSMNQAQKKYVEEYLRRRFPELTDQQHLGLYAYLEGRIANNAKLGWLKSSLTGYSEAQRMETARFLAGVVVAGGQVTPEEIKTLTRTYKLLEISPDEVYNHVHQHYVETDAEGPVTVRAGSPTSAGHRIPAKPERKQVALDAARIKSKLEDSQAVSNLLSNIFVDEDETAAPAQVTDSAQQESDIAGLDPAHSSLLRALAKRGEWSRAEFEVLATERNLMPEGALDTINEAAIETCGEPVCEGDDSIEINLEVVGEMIR